MCVWSFTWQPTFVPLFLCHFQPQYVHVLGHNLVILCWICKYAIHNERSAVFQKVLVQYSSLVQRGVVKQENGSRKQIPSYIFTYRLYVTFHKLFVGGLSQHVRHGQDCCHFPCWAICEAWSCLSPASQVQICTLHATRRVIWIYSSLRLWGFMLFSLLICMFW